MYTFAFIVCAMTSIFSLMAIIGEKVINYWMEKKGVSFDDEY